MKIVFHIIVLSFLYSYLFGQNIEENEQKVISKNGVIAKTQWDYNYSNGKTSKTGKKTIRTTYNRKGQALSVDAFNMKGEIISSEKYEYDSDGNKTLYERVSTNGKYKKAYQYNNKNQIVLEAGFNGSEPFRNTYQYNLKGLPVEIVYVLSNRTDEKRIYDYSGNTASVEVYKSGNQLASKLKLIYDDLDRITKEILYSLNNTELEKKIFEYNSGNNLVKEEKYRSGKFYYRISYTYDSNGRLLKVAEQNAGSSKFDKKVYTYNSSGQLTEYKWRRGSDDKFNVKQYTYDGKGLCISEYTYYPATDFKVLTKYTYEYF